jgi:hypothetical protein
MKNINEVDQPSTTELVDAQTLKEMTLTQEELFEIVKENTVNAFMTSMVDKATKQGAKFYEAQILANADKQLVDTISKTFINLGYKVFLSEVQPGSQSGQDTRVLTISWE